MRQRDRMRFGEPDDAVAGAAQRRVHAENDAVGIGGGPENRFKDRQGCASRNAADALLHLFKLPTRDAHAPMLPATAGLQKQKRRTSLLAVLVFALARIL